MCAPRSVSWAVHKHLVRLGTRECQCIQLRPLTVALSECGLCVLMSRLCCDCDPEDWDTKHRDLVHFEEWYFGYKSKGKHIVL